MKTKRTRYQTKRNHCMQKIKVTDTWRNSDTRNRWQGNRTHRICERWSKNWTEIAKCGSIITAVASLCGNSTERLPLVVNSNLHLSCLPRHAAAETRHAGSRIVPSNLYQPQNNKRRSRRKENKEHNMQNMTATMAKMKKEIRPYEVVITQPRCCTLMWHQNWHNDYHSGELPSQQQNDRNDVTEFLHFWRELGQWREGRVMNTTLLHLELRDSVSQS